MNHDTSLLLSVRGENTLNKETHTRATLLPDSGDLAPSSTAIITALTLRVQVLELERRRATLWTATGRRDDATTEQLRVKRLEHEAWLRRHFMKTAEAAEVLGVSSHLLQALAAVGTVTLLTTDDCPVDVCLRTVFHRGYWFARDDIDRVLRAGRAQRDRASALLN